MENDRSSPNSTKLLSYAKWVAGAVWVVLIVLALLNKDKLTMERLSTLAQQGMLPAILIFLLLFAAKGLSVVVFCGLLFAASGVLFPLHIALPVSIAGSLVMSAVPFFLGRALGEGAVHALMQGYPKLQKLSDFRAGNDFICTLIARSAGVFPSDPFSILMGALNADPMQFLLGSVVGFLPDAAAYTILGENVRNLTSPWFLLLIGVKVVTLLLSLLYLHKKKADVSAAQKA